MTTEQPPLLRQVPEVYPRLPRAAIPALDLWRPPCRRSSLTSEVQQLTNHVAFFFDSTTKDDNSLIPRHRISWPLTVSIPETFEAVYSPGIGGGDIPGYVEPRLDERLSLPSDAYIDRKFPTDMRFASDLARSGNIWLTISLCKVTGTFLVESRDPRPSIPQKHFLLTFE